MNKEASVENLQELMEAYFEGQNKTLVSIDEQVKKTNGRVTLLERIIWPAVGAVAVLTPWSFWLTQTALESQNSISPAVKLEIQAAAQAAVEAWWDDKLKEAQHGK